MMNLKWKKKICQLVSRSVFRRMVEHQGPEVFQKLVTDFDRYQQARAMAARERKKDLLAFEKRVMWGPEPLVPFSRPKPVRFDDLKRGDWFTMKPGGNTTVSVYKECDPSDPEGFGYDSAGNEYQGFEKVYFVRGSIEKTP